MMLQPRTRTALDRDVADETQASRTSEGSEPACRNAGRYELGGSDEGE
jgi:hypothetical protein